MDGWRHMATDEGYSRILTNIGEALRADMRGLIEEPPPRAILLQVLHLIRREQELRGMQQLSYDELPDNLQLLLEQLRSRG